MLSKEEIKQRLNRTIEEIKDLEKDKNNEFQNYDITTLSLRITAKVYAEVLGKQYSISENKLLKITENES
jgi:hypothetical protein